MSVILVLQVLLDVLFLVLLRRLFGERLVILVPFAVFVLATLTLPGTLWWAAALNQLPQQIFTVLALLTHLAYLRARRFRHVLLTLLALAAGLAFSEKTAFAVVLLFGMTWLFFTPGGLLRSFATACRRHWRVWIVYTALLLPYLLYYAANVSNPAREGATPTQAIDLVDIMLRRTILPGLLGGPWTWKPIGWVDSLADPNPVGQLLAVVVVGAVIATTVRRRNGAYRAWVLAVGYLTLEFGVLLATRVQNTGVEAVGAEYRYFTDFALVAALALGLATTPVRHAGADAEPGLPVLQQPRTLLPASVLPALHMPTLAVVTVGALALSATYSAVGFAERWTANPARDYVDTARSHLDDLPRKTVLYNGPVPSPVVDRLLWPANLPTRLLGPIGLDVTTLEPGMSTPQLIQFGADGSLEGSEVSGFHSEPGSDEDCGWSVRDEAVEIPLEERAFGWNWIVQLDLATPTATTLTTSAGYTTVEVPLDAGQSLAYVSIDGEVDEVTVSTAEADDRVCVRSLVVGLPQPAAW
jgi:hypothetical protein